MLDPIFALMAQNAAFFYGTVFVFSLVVGSFLNVVIHRLPIMMVKEFECECREHLADELKNPPKEDEEETAKYNLVVPRSACPHCNHQITALENIPVISWLVLRGKCSNCGAKISPRYPMVEMLTALLSVGVAMHFGYGPLTGFYLLLTWGLVALTFIDLDKMLLPDQIIFPLTWLGLLASILGYGLTPVEAIVGGLVGYYSLWTVYWAFKLTTGKEGFGYGDFSLLMLFGVFLGWQKILLIIVMSTLIGLFVGGYMMLRHNGSNKIPFGPYIAVAGWIALLWGDEIIQWYLTHWVYAA